MAHFNAFQRNHPNLTWRKNPTCCQNRITTRSGWHQHMAKLRLCKPTQPLYLGRYKNISHYCWIGGYFSHGKYAGGRILHNNVCRHCPALLQRLICSLSTCPTLAGWNKTQSGFQISGRKICGKHPPAPRKFKKGKKEKKGWKKNKEQIYFFLKKNKKRNKRRRKKEKEKEKINRKQRKKEKKTKREKKKKILKPQTNEKKPNRSPVQPPNPCILAHLTHTEHKIFHKMQSALEVKAFCRNNHEI